MVKIRPAARTDSGTWLALRCALWPEGSAAEHRLEIERYFDGGAAEPAAVLLAEHEGGSVVGFAELSIRPHAEGCRTDRVGYLEGWFVEPDSRRAGIGRALLEAAQDWARGQGCSEFASDAGADNHLSAAVHRSLGFSDAGLVRCFRKDLRPEAGRASGTGRPLRVLGNIDVDDLGRAIDFYCSAFDLKVGRRFGSGAAELLGGSTVLYLLRKEPGTGVSPATAQRRDYARHWTPVHLDFVVPEIDPAIARAQAAGAVLEGEARTQSWGRIAALADPFGHGFCLVQFLGRGYDEIAS